MLSTFLFFLFGLVILVIGAEMLVRGAVHLAASMNIPPLIIGLTVVAFGTGAPELVVGSMAAYKGDTAIALGNVIGSNIVNTLAVLGLSAAICPLVVHAQLIRFDVPIMIMASLLFYLAAWSGVITPLMGGVFFSLMIAYTFLCILKGKEYDEEFEEEYGDSQKAPGKLLFLYGILVLVGIFFLMWGANWLVEGAVDIARYFQVSEMFIALTIVAIGTSLPELATSVVAALHGKREIAVGNIVGSNIFNILAVLGFSALISPVGIPVPSSALSVDLPVLVVSALLCFPIFFTGFEVRRWEGFLFLSGYVAYNIYLIYSI